MAFGLGLSLRLLISRAACWHRHRYTHPVGARWQPQDIVSRSSTLGDSIIRFPFYRSFTTGRCTYLDSCAKDPAVSIWCSGTLPIVVVPLWSLSTNSHATIRFELLSLCCPLLSSNHKLCSCHLDILISTQAFSVSQLPTLPLCPGCVTGHHSLTEWHQSVLVHDSHTLPGFPGRADTLDTLFSSLTQILFDSASLHSRRSRPRWKQSLVE